MLNPNMAIAIEEARQGIRKGHGGPFGCVIVRDGQVIGRGHNEVIKQGDPTCHGEMMAIRDACRTVHSHDLNGCELYTTAAPCPMCAGAIQWANIKKVYYGCNVSDTDRIGFRDQIFYEETARQYEEMNRQECLKVFAEYDAIQDKTIY
ncbi:MAG: nucleoside deaminase [Lachnospiraceae bacterium]|nr:nucleoside deaminase [Lachnospiraceae bacterium]